MNSAEKYRLVGEVEPFWYVQADDGEWVLVSAVVETESPDGGQRFRLYFDDRPKMVLKGTDRVMSKPPDDGSPAAGSGTSTLD